MAHKTLISGTAYEIKGGRCLVGGTGYSIKKGRTLVDGTGYDVSFAKIITFTWWYQPDVWQAEEGMTWAEFIASDYNTPCAYYGRAFSAYGSKVHGPDRFYVDNPDGSEVLLTDVIVDGIMYGSDY